MVGRQKPKNRVQRLDTAIANITAECVWLNWWKNNVKFNFVQ